MKLNCPACGQLIPAEGVALDAGWAKCAGCHEVFRLADLLPGYATPSGAPAEGRPERPFDAWAILERSKDRLFIHIPAQGMRAGTWGMFGFAVFWLGFVAFWTAGALGVFFGHARGIRWENAIFASFSIPFWLVGFGMLGGVLWTARGSRTVGLDASFMQTQLRCLFWRRRKTIDRALVQHAREGAYLVKSDHGPSTYTPHSVEIIYENGSFRLPCNSPAEQAWLIAEINDFLQTVPYRPSPYPDPYTDFDGGWRR
ncbi:MAG: zinc-ribbon domain-containing protein [Thermoguttaceae bacterium]|jgi:hypothetical protein|nr:zinc-ribbon domain-containing protein [Thermoguttaceae bacterium]